MDDDAAASENRKGSDGSQMEISKDTAVVDNSAKENQEDNTEEMEVNKETIKSADPIHEDKESDTVKSEVSGVVNQAQPVTDAVNQAQPVTDAMNQAQPVTDAVMTRHMYFTNKKSHLKSAGFKALRKYHMKKLIRTNVKQAKNFTPELEEKFTNQCTTFLKQNKMNAQNTEWVCNWVFVSEEEAKTRQRMLGKIYQKHKDFGTYQDINPSFGHVGYFHLDAAPPVKSLVFLSGLDPEAKEADIYEAIPNVYSVVIPIRQATSVLGYAWLTCMTHAQTETLSKLTGIEILGKPVSLWLVTFAQDKLRNYTPVDLQSLIKNLHVPSIHLNNRKQRGRFKSIQRGFARAGFGPRFGGPRLGGPRFGGSQFGGPLFGSPRFSGPQFGLPRFGGPQMRGLAANMSRRKYGPRLHGNIAAPIFRNRGPDFDGPNCDGPNFDGPNFDGPNFEYQDPGPGFVESSFQDVVTDYDCFVSNFGGGTGLNPDAGGLRLGPRGAGRSLFSLGMSGSNMEETRLAGPYMSSNRSLVSSHGMVNRMPQMGTECQLCNTIGHSAKECLANQVQKAKQKIQQSKLHLSSILSSNTQALSLNRGEMNTLPTPGLSFNPPSLPGAFPLSDPGRRPQVSPSFLSGDLDDYAGAAASFQRSMQESKYRDYDSGLAGGGRAQRMDTRPMGGGMTRGSKVAVSERFIGGRGQVGGRNKRAIGGNRGYGLAAAGTNKGANIGSGRGYAFVGRGDHFRGDNFRSDLGNRGGFGEFVGANIGASGDSFGRYGSVSHNSADTGGGVGLFTRGTHEGGEYGTDSSEIMRIEQTMRQMTGNRGKDLKVGDGGSFGSGSFGGGSDSGFGNGRYGGFGGENMSGYGGGRVNLFGGGGDGGFGNGSGFGGENISGFSGENMSGFGGERVNVFGGGVDGGFGGGRGNSGGHGFGASGRGIRGGHGNGGARGFGGGRGKNSVGRVRGAGFRGKKSRRGFFS